MKKHRPSVGISDWFARFETTPGNIDPRTGKLVPTTAIRTPSMIPSGFARFETSPGRIDPRTGRPVQPTALMYAPPAALPALPAPAAASRGFSPRSWTPGEAGMTPAMAGRLGLGRSRADAAWSVVGVSLLIGFAFAAILEGLNVVNFTGTSRT
jgi:hypothetical protein